MSKVNNFAIFDGLTGIYNRRYFLERLNMEFDRCKRYNRKLSIAMIDIDYFKKVNDTFGHKAGDIVLAKVAKTCKDSIRAEDIIGRFGGEEFIAVLVDTDESEHIVERVRMNIEKLKIEVSENVFVSVTVSIGLVIYLPEQGNMELSINQADDALYESKKNGCNRITVIK